MKTLIIILILIIVFLVSIGSTNKVSSPCICPCEDVWIVVEADDTSWKVFVPKGYFNDESKYWKDGEVNNAK